MNEAHIRGLNGSRVCCLFATLIVGLVTPSLVKVLTEITIGGIAPLMSLQNIAHHQFAEGHSLFPLALSLIPFAALCSIMLCLSGRLTRSQFYISILLGLVGILAYMIPSHASVWRPLYTDEHASACALLAFIYIPFRCLVTMTIGLTVAYLFSVLVSHCHRIRAWLTWINDH